MELYERELWNQGTLFAVGGWCLQRRLNGACHHKSVLRGTPEHRWAELLMEIEEKWTSGRAALNIIMYFVLWKYLQSENTGWTAQIYYKETLWVGCLNIVLHGCMIITITTMIKFLPLYHYHKVIYSFKGIHARTQAHPHTPAAPQATIIN